MDKFDFVVIGSGPGGYVSAIRAAQLGLKTAIIEKDEHLGGTCLNIGCIPSKALLESSEWYHSAQHKFQDHGINLKGVGFDLNQMMTRKQKIVRTLTDGVGTLMKKNKVKVYHGTGNLTGDKQIDISTGSETVSIKADAIVLAMGSLPVELPFMPFDHKQIVDSTDALSFDTVPKSMAVIGAGAIGLELGSVWRRLGADVSVFEMLPQIAPFADKQMSIMLQRYLAQQGLNFHLKAKVTGAKVVRNKVELSYELGGESSILKVDKVLVAVGRKPNSSSAGIQEYGIKIGNNGFVETDNWKTNVDGIYAIGDLVDGPMLAHKAEEEGIAVAEIVAGKPGHVNFDAIPNVIYTWPELAAVGINEEEAKANGIKYRVGKFFFRGNGRALSMGETDGLVKVIADAESDQVLGVHIVGPRASDMIAEAVLGMEFKVSSEDIARTSHAHPSLSEALKEAAMAVDKRQIHG